MDTCNADVTTTIPPPKFSFANPIADVGDSSPRMTVCDEAFLKELLEAQAKRRDTSNDEEDGAYLETTEETKPIAPPTEIVEEDVVETVTTKAAFEPCNEEDSGVVNNNEATAEEAAPSEETTEEAPQAVVVVDVPAISPSPEVAPSPSPSSPPPPLVTTVNGGFRKGLVYLHRPPRTPLASTSTYDVIVSSLSHRLDKWDNVMRFLKAGGVDAVTYSHVWFPDVTTDVNANVAGGLFDAIASGADKIALIQPSVVPCARGFTHEALVARDATETTRSSLRKSQLVEHKYPCFSTEFATSCLQAFLAENAKHLRSGWGMDLWWSTHESVKDSCYVAETAVVHDTYNPTIAKTVGRKEMQYYARKYPTIVRK